MLNKLQNTMKSRKLLRIAVSMLIAVLMSGYILPDYAAFAENEPEKQEEAGGLSASEQVEDDGENSKSEHKTVSAADQVEDTVNKDAAKDQNDEDKKELSAQDQVEDEADHEYEYAKSGDFNAEIKGYKVNADVPEGAFDDEVRLQIKEAVANKDDAVNEEEDVVELTEEQKKALSERLILNAKHLDISFIGKDGKQREPSKEVGIEMSITKELIADVKGFDESASGVVHLSERKNGEIKSVDLVVDPEKNNKKAVTYDKKEKEVTVKFAADDFSVYSYTDGLYWMDLKFYFADKGNMNKVITDTNPGFGTDYNNSTVWNMPNWIVKKLHNINYVDATYKMETGNNYTFYDLVIPFGYEFDNAYALDTGGVHAGFPYRSNTMQQRVNTANNNAQTKNIQRLSLTHKPNATIDEERMYFSYVIKNGSGAEQTITINNPSHKYDFAAVYKRLSASELPIYAVAEGSRTPLANTLAGFINDATFTNGYKVNDNNTATSSNKYNMTFTNGQFMAFNKNYSTVRETADSKFVFCSAYIVRDDGTTEGQEIDIKGLRYDGSKNLWFYSEDGNMDNTSALKFLTSNDKVYIEFSENITPSTTGHRLYFRDGDGARNSNGDYPALSGSDGKDYFDIGHKDYDNFKIDFVNDQVTYNGQTKSLKEMFGINADKELYKGFIRHATSGNIDGNKSNEIEYIQKTNGQLKIKMKDKTLTNLSNKAVYAIFHKDPDLKELNTIDNNALGFHVHMFNYPKSPMLFARDDNAWGAEYRRGITREGSTREGETEQGLYGKTTTGGTKYSERFPNIEKVFVWKNGATFLEPPAPGMNPEGITNLSGIFNPSSSNKNYVGEANHLFLSKIYDEKGYMYYNSEENAAVLNPKGSNGLMDFSVYNAIVSPVQGIDNNGKEYFQYGPDSFFYHRGNFLPFNNIDLDKRYAKNLYDANGYTWGDEERKRSGLAAGDNFNTEAVAKDPATTVYGIKEGRVASHGTPDYFHGMYAYMNFQQPVGGMVTQLPNGTTITPEPMVYEFTGDDDMMVYIDGVLVLDLGGVHDAQSGKIDFSTGDVTYSFNGSYTPSGKVDRSPIIDDKRTTTIKDQFQNAGKSGVSWRGNTFADATYHTIQIFYMERGQGASNLKIKVNIPPVPDAFFTVEKKVNEVKGVTKDPDEEFTMKVEYQNENGQWRPIDDLDGVQKLIENPDGTFSTETMRVSKYYLDDHPETLLDIGANGIIKLKDGQRACIPGIIDNDLKVRVTETASSKHNLAGYYDIDYSLTSNGQIISNNNNQISVQVPATKTMGVVVGNTPEVFNSPKTAELTVSKIVTSDNYGSIDANKSFKVVVKVTGLTGEFSAVKRNGSTNTNETVNFNSGQATIYLKHNESMTINGLPVGATYTVTEQFEGTDSQIYEIPVYANQSGILSQSGNNATITNTRKTVEVELTKTAGNGSTPLSGVTFALYELKVGGEGRIYARESGSNSDLINDTPLVSNNQGKINLTALINTAIRAGKGTAINQIDGISGKRGFLLYETSPKAGYKKATAPWVILVDEATYNVEVREHGNRYAKPAIVWEDGVTKAWNVSDFAADTAIISNGVLKNDEEPEHKIVKVNENTIPKVGGSFKETLTEAEKAALGKLPGAKFRVFESTSQTINGDNHIIFAGLQKLTNSDGSEFVLQSGEGGVITLPKSMNPSAEQDARYYLLEEIEAPSGYAKSKKPFAVKITRSGIDHATDPVVDADSLYIVNDITLPIDWSTVTSLDCTNIGSGHIPYAVIPNKPINVELTKVRSDQTGTKLPNAKFRLYKTQWDRFDKYVSDKKAFMAADDWSSYTDIHIRVTDRVGADAEIKSVGSNAKITLPITEAGEYFLFEEEAPQGYEWAKAPWLVIVDEYGNVQLRHNTNPDYVLKGSDTASEGTTADPDFATLSSKLNTRWWPASNYAKSGDLNVKNDRKPIKLTKYKTGTDTKLAGAEFVFGDVGKSGNNYMGSKAGLIKNGSQIIKVTSGSDGEIDITEVFDNLKSDQGRLFESDGYKTVLMYEIKAPTGHKISTTPWLVKIDADRNVTLQKYTGTNETYANLVKNESFLSGEWAGNNKDRFTWAPSLFGPAIDGSKVNNDPITIAKVDEETKNPLSGAEFEIWLAELKYQNYKYYYAPKQKLEGPDTAADGTKVFKSGLDGKIDVSSLYEHITPDSNQFFLVYEKKAPNGYDRVTTPWLLTYESSPKSMFVYSNSIKDINLAGYNSQGWVPRADFLCDGSGEIKNSKTNNELQKVDEKTLQGLGGVSFKLYYGNYVYENNWTKKKVNGEYVVKRTSSPKTFTTTNAGQGKFSVNNLSGDGVLILEETSPKDGYIRENAPWVIEYTGGIIRKIYQHKNPSTYDASQSEINLCDYEDTHDAKYIKNKKEYELPSAGGIGVYPFTIIGTMMVMIALVLLFARKENEEC